MIPDHLIDKGVDALINPARTTDMVPDWRLDVYRDTIQRIIEAVAADIWDQGCEEGIAWEASWTTYHAGAGNRPDDIANPYKRNENA